ncbi:MAG: HlyD family efflux transporter periplasmic adaptor subunit [Pirellulales bacterium]
MRNLGSKFFVLLLVAAIVVGLGYAFVPQPLEVDLATIGRGTLRVTVDEDGKTRIREKYVVSAPLAGRLLRINMDPGDEVHAGKTLLTLIEPRDPDLLDARSIAQAEARVRAAEATLRKVEPMLEEARVAQAYAEAELARLRSAGVPTVSRTQLDNAELLYRQRSEQMRSARIAQEIAAFELEQAKAALMRSRPHADEAPGRPASDGGSTTRTVAGETDPNTPNGSGGWNFPIYSPIDGRVLRVLQESAAVVTPGTPLVELGNPLDLEVEVDVLSRDAVEIQPGDLAMLEHWGGNRPLVGHVRIVEPSGFTKISTLGVEEQRVNVIIDLDDPPEKRRTLGDGFRVEARIVVDEARDVLIVPTSALFRVGDQSAVFRVAGGIVERRIVELGRQNGLQAEIVKGLAEGDQVVLHPSDQIEPGVEVIPRKSTSATAPGTK